jgi:hypothetical protein
MKLDIGKVLTAATSDQAHAGQMGWFGDSIMDLMDAMGKNPVELKEIRSEFHYPFLDSAGKGYLFFYPDEPSCEASR